VLAERHDSRKAYRLQELRRWSKRLGLKLDLQPMHFPVNPAPSSYSILSAIEAGGGDLPGLVQAFPRAVWAEGRDIAEEDVVKAILAENSFDPAIADRYMMSAADTYVRNLEEAVQRGVFGVPFYIVGEERFWGQDRLEDLESSDMPEDMVLAALPPHRVWMRGGSRPVLALHCSLAHSGAWSALAGRLEGITLTAIDQVGHGNAPSWDGVSDLHGTATEASILAAEHLGQGAAVDLLGHSFGATVALRIALMRPDLVRSLTLVEPVIFAAADAAGDPAFAPFRARHMAFADLIAAGERETALRMFHGDWGTGDALDALPERTRSYMFDRIHLIAAQNPVLLDDAAHLLRPDGLEAVQVPVLLIDGADSPPIIEAVQRALARRLPRAERLSVPGAGHMVSITHAAEIAPAVQAHLNAS
jgi:2-hydroxychromene-2-carboxylate isomerase/alpha-beta hydrolase superfamily lysophospholipase